MTKLIKPTSIVCTKSFARESVWIPHLTHLTTLMICLTMEQHTAQLNIANGLGYPEVNNRFVYAKTEFITGTRDEKLGNFVISVSDQVKEMDSSIDLLVPNLPSMGRLAGREIHIEKTGSGYVLNISGRMYISPSLLLQLGISQPVDKHSVDITFPAEPNPNYIVYPVGQALQLVQPVFGTIAASDEEAWIENITQKLSAEAGIAVEIYTNGVVSVWIGIGDYSISIWATAGDSSARLNSPSEIFFAQQIMDKIHSMLSTGLS